MVFLSWAGDRAKKVAMALDSWLPLVVHGVGTWFSPNIEAGRRWDDTMATALQHANLGILCLTQDNMREPWIAFEAGALAKQVEVARVVPFLLDLTPGNLSGTPLASFQAKGADKEGAIAIVRMLNGLVAESQRRTDEHLLRQVEAHWPSLQQAIEIAKAEAPAAKPEAPDVTKMVEEVLALLRGVATTIDRHLPLASVEKSIDADAAVEEEGSGVTEDEDAASPPALVSATDDHDEVAQ